MFVLVTSRSMTAIEVVDFLINSYIEAPVKDWGIILNEADFPGLGRSMAGTFGTVLVLLIPPEVIEILAPIIFDFFSWM